MIGMSDDDDGDDEVEEERKREWVSGEEDREKGTGVRPRAGGRRRFWRRLLILRASEVFGWHIVQGVDCRGKDVLFSRSISLSVSLRVITIGQRINRGWSGSGMCIIHSHNHHGVHHNPYRHSN
jgi:hypothetical protein